MSLQNVTNQLKTLRLKSETNRAARAAAGSGQNAERAQPAPKGSGRSSSETEKANSQGRGISQKVNFNLTPRSRGGNTPSGSVRTLATKLKASTRKIQKQTALEKALDTWGNVNDGFGFHPYDGNKAFGPLDHEPLKDVREDVIRVHVQRMAERSEKLEHPYVSTYAAGIPVNWAQPTSEEFHTATHTEAMKMTSLGPGMLMSGRESLYGVASPAATTLDAGSVIVSFPLNPRIILSSRLQTFAGLYTRFIFKKIRVCYAQIAGTGKDGQMQMFYIQDPMVNPALKPGDGLVAYGDTDGAIDFPVWSNAVLNISDSNFKDFLFMGTQDDVRWSDQGCVYVVCSGQIAQAITCGRLFMDYEILMANDQVALPYNYTNRKFASVSISIPAQTAGPLLITKPAALAYGVYWASFEFNPALTGVYTSKEAYATRDPNQVVSWGKGFGCYAVVLNNNGTDGLVLAQCPDCFQNPLDVWNDKGFYLSTSCALTTGAVTFYALSNSD